MTSAAVDQVIAKLCALCAIRSSIVEEFEVIFHVSYGWENRVSAIKEFAEDDLSIGVVLSAAHFEWAIKRAILVLGASPTKEIRDDFANNWRQEDLKSLWKREVRKTRPQAGTLPELLGAIWTKIEDAGNARARIMHGNGTPSQQQAREAMNTFLSAADKIRQFVEHEGECLDARLRPRRRNRDAKSTRGSKEIDTQ